VHDNWKDAIVNAAETDTVFLNRFAKPGLRALRTERSSRLEREEVVNMLEFGTAKDLYFGGDMEASLALGGQVMGRIESVRSVVDIIQDTVREFFEIVSSLSDTYLGERVP
jgi:enoyl-[acyl-carrier protein] reductase II